MARATTVMIFEIALGVSNKKAHYRKSPRSLDNVAGEHLRLEGFPENQGKDGCDAG